MKLPLAQAPGAAAFTEQRAAEDPHGMLYDNPQFWDSRHTQSELHRVFEICNGCRLCFNLCPSFDVLFRRIDALDPNALEAEGKHLAMGLIEEHEAAEKLKHIQVSTENPVSLLTDADNARVVELCYECKLCYPKCPYVPPHEFAVDFPKLMLRAKMNGAKEDGIPFRERFLGATDLVGGLMTKIAPLANAAAHNAFNRKLMEQTLGIAAQRQLPDYAAESFETWWKRRAPVEAPETPSGAVALFHTCFVNYNDPSIGQAAVDVLERAGCAVDCPEQVCCGMPKLDGGDIAGARKLAARNAELLLPHVRAGKTVLSPGPSCTLMLRQEYPELIGAAGKKIAAATMDLSDYVLQLGRQKKLPKPPPGIGKVAFHVACHNRVQNFGYRGRDLLKWAGGDVTLVDRCCGMDGTWGMKSEFFEESLKVAEPAARKVESIEPDVVSSDCPLAGLQLRQKTGRASYHPVKILQAAYRGAHLRSTPVSNGETKGVRMMQQLTTKDLWPLPVYEGVRDQFRKEVVAAKKDRRIDVGPGMTFVFENRLTVKFQVLEILRAERITAPEHVAEELEGFNTMLPGEGELSATLLIAFTGSEAEVAKRLEELVGLSAHVFLEVGGKRVQGKLEGGREDGKRVSAVQYVRFHIGDARALLDEKIPVRLAIDHPAYRHAVELPEGMRRSLSADLSGAA
ncbi:MAG TPA: DUF3501 family protein [Myxococcales bacterium]|nr:DUF3501 family protein [Myxococcales bacterium]